MFRKNAGRLEVLLAHPGGPYFRNKSDGIWTVPKGEAAENEDLLARARIEFEEELGVKSPEAALMDLGSIKQKGGKTVHAWAFEGSLRDDFLLNCNSFEMEWPPRSGKMESFPEIDQVDFFSVGQARSKINPAQIAFLDRLIELLNRPPPHSAAVGPGFPS
jgi:predicted NUDIX family NTP pyrophosphohydrolase